MNGIYVWTMLICSLLLSGCIENGSTNNPNQNANQSSFCGNGIIETGETNETCCEDVGCLGGQVCTTHKCVSEIKNPTCGTESCSKNQVCINDHCVLNYKYGLVYVYDSSQTRNPDWHTQLSVLYPKIEHAVSELTNNKINISIIELGEVQTDTFCWTPPTIGVKLLSSDGTISYDVCPGSGFSFMGTDYPRGVTILELNCSRSTVEEVKKVMSNQGEITCDSGITDWETAPNQCNVKFKGFYCDGSTGNLVLDCQKCGCSDGMLCNEDGGCDSFLGKSYKVAMNCENALPNSTVRGEKQQQLENEISQKLNFQFSDYDGIFVIFGSFGPPLDTEERFLSYKCSGIYPYIGGYSTLEMAENAILEPVSYLVNCSQLNTQSHMESFYLKVGWHTMVHEILHRFGAVDVYETGSVFGITTYRDEALKIDSRTDESIMGDDLKSCMDRDGYEKDGVICSKADLDAVYLDKYNAQRIHTH